MATGVATASDRLAIQHQKDVAGVAGGVASAVIQTAMGADPAAISTWFFSALDGLMARIQAGYALNRRSAMGYLPQHGALNRVTVSAVPGSLDIGSSRARLNITGPVAFKRAISAGYDESQALRSMASQMGGVADELVRNGDRDVITQTIRHGRGLVAYRRRLVGKSCGFCAMLASRGAVYTAESVTFRTHAHCRCFAEPVYRHQQEPPEVQRLQRQWRRVTAGKHGDEAVRTWRRHWEQRATPAARLREGIAPPRPATLVDDYAERAMTRREYEIANLEQKIATAKADRAEFVKSWERAIAREGPNGDPATLAYYRGALENARNLPTRLRQELADVRKRKDPALDLPHPTAKLRTGTPSPQRAQAYMRGQVGENITGADRAAITGELERQAALVPRSTMRLGDVRFGEIGEDISFGGDPLAAYSPFNDVLYSRRWMESRAAVEESVQRSITSKWWTRYDGQHGGIGGVTAHEFGHHIDRLIGRTPAQAKQLAEAISREFHFPLDPKALDFRAEIQRFVSENEHLVSVEISKYGAKNANEMFAEIWREYSTMGTAARPKIRRIGELMRQLAEDNAFGPTIARAGERALAHEAAGLGPDEIIRAVQSGVAHSERLSGGVSGSSLVTMNDGTKLILKTARVDEEQAAALVARALGIGPRVYRDGNQIWIEYIEAPSAAKMRQTAVKAGNDALDAFDARVDRIAESDQGQLVGLLDQLTRNTDRNFDNWLIGAGDRPIPVDNGMTFTLGRLPEDFRLTRPPRSIFDLFSGQYTTENGEQWAANRLTRADVAEVRRRLAALEPEFEALGRPDWLRYSRQVLDAIEPYAQGTRNLVAERALALEAADLSVLKLPQLRALAKERGLTGYSKLTKPQLLERLGGEATSAVKPAGALRFDERAAQALGGQSAHKAVPVSVLRESGLTAAEKQAIHQYRGIGFGDINDKLWETKGRVDLPTVREIDAAMSRSALSDEVLVWRGIPNAEEFYGARWASDMSGFEWTEHSYLSTTTSQNMGKSFAARRGAEPGSGALLEIVAPRGVHGIELSDLTGESEILLERGLKLRVVSDTGVGPSRVLKVEIVPAASKSATADLAKLKVTELRALAKERGVTGYSKLTKPQLLDALGGEAKPGLAQAGRHATRSSTLSAAQKAAVARYTNSDLVAARINGILRGSKKITAEIRQIDAAMAASMIEQDAILFRGISELSTLNRQGGVRRALGFSAEEPLPGNLVGHEFTEPGFASTTTRAGISHVFSSGEEGLRLEIRAPAGTHAVQIPGGEGEILLDRGLRYRVVGDRIDTEMVGLRHDTPLHHRVLTLEIVPDARAKTLEGDLVIAARERQAAIDFARTRADLLTEAEHWLDSQGSFETMGAQLRRDAKRLGVEGHKDVAALFRALDSGSEAKVRKAIDAIAGKQKLARIESAGDVVRFDRTKHAALGKGVRDGQYVVVVRPGYTFDRSGEIIRLHKATVQVATKEDIAAARKARKPTV